MSAWTNTMMPITTSAPPALSRWRRIPGPPRDPAKAQLLRLHRTLLDRLGPQAGRRGRTPFEIAVGAIVAEPSAIVALRRARLLSPRGLARIDEVRLAATIRPAGARLKARRLQRFARWVLREPAGRFGDLRRRPLGSLAASLLAVPGVGAETVDAILLFAARRPVFVAGATTRRVLAARGLMRASAGYEDARRFLEAHLPSDPALFIE